MTRFVFFIQTRNNVDSSQFITSCCDHRASDERGSRGV